MNKYKKGKLKKEADFVIDDNSRTLIHIIFASFNLIENETVRGGIVYALLESIPKNQQSAVLHQFLSSREVNGKVVM